MKEKTWKILVKIVCFVLTLALFAPVINVSANESDGKGYEVDKKLLKKLKKNAIAYYPDPNSKELTWGYAAYKIKTFLEGDENAYLDNGVNLLRIAGDIKISGGTKKQRKALKWCIDKGIVEYHNRYYDYSKGGNKTKFNTGEKITRWQLVDLVSRVIGYGYGSRIPYLNDWEKGFTWNPKEEWILDEYDCQCIDKCVMYIKPSGGTGEYLHLDDCIATRDDLSRCLKNLKLIAASKYTAKVVYYDEPLKAYTNDAYLKDLQEIKEIIASMNLEFYKAGGMKDEFWVQNGTSGKRIYKIDIFFNEDYFVTFIQINGGHGVEKRYGINYDPKKVDIVETFKEILTKRG